MLSGKLYDSLSDGVSRASRFMSISRSSSGDGERAEASNSSDFMLRSVEVLSSVKLRVGATSRFFLTVLPVRAKLVGGTSGKKDKKVRHYKGIHFIYTTIQKFKISKIQFFISTSNKCFFLFI